MPLLVRLIKAQKLNVLSPKGYRNPSVIVSIGTCTFKLISKLSNLEIVKDVNPVYNHVIKFKIEPPIEDNLSVTFMEYEGGKAVVIGKSVISVAGLKWGEEKVEWYPLGERSSHGEVKVGISADFTEKKKEDVKKSNIVMVNPDDFNDKLLQTNTDDVGEEKPENKIRLKRFKTTEIEKEIRHFAKGAFGKIYRGTCKGIDKQIVIKEMDVKEQASIQEWKNEIQMMKLQILTQDIRAGKNPYLVKIYGYIRTRKMLGIVLEYMEKGSLFDLLHKRKERLSQLQRVRMGRHCALGLAYLHTKNVIHRDIKSMNILVSNDYKCKITDFGCAKLMDREQMFHTLNRGSPLWMAPEVKGGVYSFAADIYSLGIVFYEIFQGVLPPIDEKTREVHIPYKFPSARFVLPLVRIEAVKRPTAAVVVQLLDGILRRLVDKVRSTMSQQELDAISALDVKSKGDNLDDKSSVLYRYLLTKPPEEVDLLISKAFKSSNSSTEQNTTKTSENHQQNNHRNRSNGRIIHINVSNVGAKVIRDEKVENNGTGRKRRKLRRVAKRNSLRKKEAKKKP